MSLRSAKKKLKTPSLQLIKFCKENFSWLYICLLLLLVILASTLHIHGSSVGMYNRIYYGQNYDDPNLLVNEPRSIRSDEWKVATPLALSQAHNDFKHYNDKIGFGQEMSLVYEAPNNHWSTFFRIFNWGFFLFDFETAFAFKWWIRGFLLVVATYLLIKKLTDSKLLGLTASIAMFFAPMIQWWYSVFVLETVTYSFFIIYLVLQIISSTEKKKLLIYTLLLSYLLVAYLFINYPPYQISFAMGMTAIISGYLLNNKPLLNKQNLVQKLKYFGFAGITLLIIAAKYFSEFSQIISIIMHTSYPGTRRIEGGTFSVVTYAYGFLNIASMTDVKNFPELLHNQSEAASFFLIAFFSVPVFVFYSIKRFLKKQHVDYLLLFIYFFLGITSIWMLIGLPIILGKLLLFNLIPHNRMFLAVGAFNFITMFYFISKFKVDQQHIKYKFISILSAIVIVVGYLFFSYKFHTNYPAFITKEILMFSCSLLLIITLSYLLKKTWLFAISLILFSIASTLQVNPLYKGLTPLTDSQLGNKLSAIARQQSDKRWISYDTLTNGTLVANGINSLGGTHLYPQFDLWEILDPNQSKLKTYNSYANVSFSLSTTNDIEISRPGTGAINVKVSPCNPVLKQLNVGFVVLNKQEKYNCLIKIDELLFPAKQIFIYQIK